MLPVPGEATVLQSLPLCISAMTCIERRCESFHFKRFPWEAMKPFSDLKKMCLYLRRFDNLRTLDIRIYKVVYHETRRHARARAHPPPVVHRKCRTVCLSKFGISFGGIKRTTSTSTVFFPSPLPPLRFESARFTFSFCAIGTCCLR